MGTSGAGARLNALHAIEERIAEIEHAQHVERASSSFVIGAARGTVPHASPIPSARTSEPEIEPFDPDVFAPLYLFPDDESE